MIGTTWQQRRDLEGLDRAALAEHQLTRLNRLLEAILPANHFYAEKFGQLDLPLASLDQLAELPFTFKDELAQQRDDALAANHTFPLDQYVRFHQTSGTRGRPMVVLDTADDWQWWIDSWQFVLDAADLKPSDRAMMAFSFGPFIGFWSACDAAVARGLLVVPGGGMNTLARLELLRTSEATVVFCTPTYALHVAEVAAEHQIDVAALAVRKLIVAGEPGGSVSTVRERIEQAWGAAVLDHSGATEVGPWGYGDHEGNGLYVLESEFIAEMLSVETGRPATEGELSEIVITSLGRVGSPVIRYRSGDLVRPTWTRAGDNRFVFLEGGVLGRTDDMMVIRGVNIFPAAVEQILRSFPEVVEYRMTATKDAEMDRLRVEIEDRLDQPQRVAEELRLRLGLKIEVTAATLGSLPRFEGKGRRFIDNR
ncbi:MAG: phenylacetate--CoA ligase family protein [Planctomycetes bacterium]|nr:phenylacetate--CoA ligase family protein [Planctomycetota bacterium]